MLELFKRYQETAEQQVLLSYKGRLSFNLVQMFIDQIEKTLEQDDVKLPSKKKVFNVLVEVFQNLTHHIDHTNNPEITEDFKKASLKVWLEDGKCHIATGNFIQNINEAKLAAWLGKINSLDNDGVRQLYKETLNNNTFSEKGGGGLGFLDIARKTGTKLIYKFEKIDENFSYFNFETNISIENI
jgi:hypothetical protein